MVRIAGLSSDRGRNLARLHDLAPGGAELSVVLSDRAGAPVLDAAAERDVPTAVVEREADRPAHEARVRDALGDHEFDLLCIDRYDRILSGSFLAAMPTTLVVHPSLLPAFEGLDAPADALAAGARVTGATVYVATEDVGAGQIVTQEPVPVYEGDDPDSVTRRIREEGEYRAYPRAVKWFAEGRVSVEGDAVSVEGDDGGAFPARRVASDDRVRDLRYGENPHQDAALYADATVEEASVVGAPQLNEGARALSYNNYNDADGALDLIKEFDEPAAAVIKHTSPAGCATAASLADAYDRALRTDPKSAFGGIVALNRECDAATAEGITESYKEVVVAPGYTDDGLDVLTESDSLRVLDAGDRLDATEPMTEKQLVGGRLVQERDRKRLTADDLEVVTEREPTEEQVESMLFGWHVVKHVMSNAVLFATGTETVGVGAGQLSRVDAVKVAKMKAEADAEGKSAEGAVMASDAFFPFPDNIEVAAEAGVEAVIQPGGSVNDDDVIEAANELDVAMVFTDTRAFRHS